MSNSSDQMIDKTLSFPARVDLEAMVMKVYSAFLKAPALLKPHHWIVLCYIQDTRWGGSYPSAEIRSVYSTTPADRIIFIR